MKKTNILMVMIIAALMAFALRSGAFAHEHHHGDFMFGAADGAAAVIEPEADEMEPVTLSPFDTLYSNDWGVNFYHEVENVFQLSSVRIQMVDISDGLYAYQGADAVFGNGAEFPGYFDLSASGVHHAHFDFYALNPGAYTFSFKLVNAFDPSGNALADSGVYTVEFNAVPEPAGLVALGTPMVAFLLRRRK